VDRKGEDVTQSQGDSARSSTSIVHTRFADGALPLYDLGWAPIPLAPGEKKPVARWKGWNTARPARQHILHLIRTFPESAIGVAVPETAFIVDADILDEQVQAQVLKGAFATLGRPPMIRVGRWPKIMLFYGCAPGSLRSRKLHPIELFSGSGQVVVGGIHHATRQPYSWSRVTPWITLPTAITPTVTLDQVNAFLTAIEPTITGMKQKMARRYGSSHAHRFGVDVLPAFREEFAARTRWYRKKGGKHERAAQKAAAQQMLRQAVPPEAGFGDRHFRVMVLTEQLVFRGWEVRAVIDAFQEVFDTEPELYPEYDNGHWSKKTQQLAEGAVTRLAKLRAEERPI
jgi:hypothetical protein